MGVRWPRGSTGGDTHVQHAAGDGQGGIRRDDVDVVRLDRRLRRDLLHGHPGVPRQQFRQEARAVGGEVLDEHEGHAAVRRHLREERLEGLQAARGRAHTHNDTARCGPLCGRAASACAGVCGSWEVSSFIACSASKKCPCTNSGDSDLT